LRNVQLPGLENTAASNGHPGIGAIWLDAHSSGARSACDGYWASLNDVRRLLFGHTSVDTNSEIFVAGKAKGQMSLF
jgi:hypothetical protein